MQEKVYIYVYVFICREGAQTQKLSFLPFSLVKKKGNGKRKGPSLRILTLYNFVRTFSLFVFGVCVCGKGFFGENC